MNFNQISSLYSFKTEHLSATIAHKLETYFTFWKFPFSPTLVPFLVFLIIKKKNLWATEKRIYIKYACRKKIMEN